MFDEHRIAFPIKDPSQLQVSLGALSALYSRVENAALYDGHDPITQFVEFVGRFVGDKQSQPKS